MVGHPEQFRRTETTRISGSIMRHRGGVDIINPVRRAGSASGFRARKGTRRVAKFVASSIVGHESALASASDEAHRQAALGRLDSFRDAGNRKATHPNASWLADHPREYVTGYRSAQLEVASYAALVFMDLDPEPSRRSVSRAAGIYVLNSRYPPPGLTTVSMGGTQYMGRPTVPSKGPAASLEDLVVEHAGACANVPKDFHQIPAEAELAWFRWLAAERGLLPLARGITSHMVWLNVATRLHEIPPWVGDALVEQRNSRGWTYQAPALGPL